MHMTNGKLAIATGVLLLGGAWLVHDLRAPAGPTIPRSTVDPARDEAAPAEQVRAPALRRRAADAPPPRADEAPAEAPADAPVVSAAAAEQAILARLDGQLAREANDPQWSTAAEARIAEALRGDGMAGTSLVAVDCQSSLCRVDVVHADSEAQERFFEAVPLAPPFDTQGFMNRTVTADGAARTRLYVARVGHALPRPQTI